MTAGSSGPYPGAIVYTVHATNAENVGAITAVFTDLKLARDYAQGRSSDIGILCAAINSFRLDELGTRTAVTWFLRGVEQTKPYGQERVNGQTVALTETP